MSFILLCQDIEKVQMNTSECLFGVCAGLKLCAVIICQLEKFCFRAIYLVIFRILAAIVFHIAIPRCVIKGIECSFIVTFFSLNSKVYCFKLLP